MKLQKISQINKFLDVVNSCHGNVWLTSQLGDKYNLKSHLSQYIAIAALLGDKGDELELWCDEKEDEYKFLSFFNDNPDVR